MSELTVANYLGALQQAPYSEDALEGLLQLLTSPTDGEPSPPLPLLEFARHGHEVRGEMFAAARLIEIEVVLVDDDPNFEAALWKELGRIRREELLDDGGAKVAYERALALREGDDDIRRALQQIEEVSENWAVLVDNFVDQAESASDDPLRAHLLVRAATIVWQYQKGKGAKKGGGRAKRSDRLFEAARQADPASARSIRLHERTLRERRRWEPLASMLAAAATQVSGRDNRLGMFLAAARIYAGDLSDAEQAALCYQEALDYVPGHEESMSYLAGYFTEREEWEHLIALYEDALGSRHVKSEAEQGILLQIAMVHWRMRGEPARARPYFERLRKLNPGQPAMLGFFRELGGAEADMEARAELLAVLSDAQRVATGTDSKAALSVEIARLAGQHPEFADRAIDSWKLVLRNEPGNLEAGEALKKLYRETGKWNALVEVLREESTSLGPVVEDEPLAQKERRLGLLQDLLGIYRDHLQQDNMVVSTYRAILEVDPEDVEALSQMAETFESAGRYKDLIPLLQRKAEAAQDPSIRSQHLLRIAALWIDQFSNYQKATGPLEQVVELDPGNQEALDRLRGIYGKKRAWKSLRGVLEQKLALCSDQTEAQLLRVELARLCGDRLHERDLAITLWREAFDQSESLPEGVGEEESLRVLEKLAERAKQWDSVAWVQERRIAVAATDADRVKLLYRLGALWAERANEPSRAAAVWRRVLELQPGNKRALRTLREAHAAAGDWDAVQESYAAANDWDGLVSVLAGAAALSEDDEVALSLSFRAAEVCESELSDPVRAIPSYEQVLARAADNVRAASALLGLYESERSWRRVADMLQLLLDLSPEGATDERVDLQTRLARVTMLELHDPDAAFAHASAVYALAPGGPGVRENLEAAALSSGKVEPLVELFVARRGQCEPDESLLLGRRIAEITAGEMGQPERAAEQLESLLVEHPGDTESLALLERIYRTSNRPDELRKLLERRISAATDEDVRIGLFIELAMLEEELLSRPEAAVERYEAILEIQADNQRALAALDRLAQAGGDGGRLEQVLRRRIEASNDQPETLALQLRLGELLAGERDDVEAAIHIFAEVLGQEPGEPSAVAALEGIETAHEARAVEVGALLESFYRQAEQHASLARVLRTRLADHVASDSPSAERIELSMSLAGLLSGQIGDAAGAFQVLSDAFELQPGNESVWDEMARVAQVGDLQDELGTAWDKVLGAWSIKADSGDGEADGGDLDLAGAARLSARLCQIYDRVLLQPEKAEPHHQRVLLHDPQAVDAFQALKDLFTNQERWEELKVLYRNRIAELVDPEAKLDLLHQVCFLFEEILDDLDMAVRAHEEVLELSPDNSASARALDRLYARAERWRDLVALLERSRDRLEGSEATALEFRLGELYRDRMRDNGVAVDQFSLVLDKEAGHPGALEALEGLLSDPEERTRVADLLVPIYDASGAHASLVRGLEVQLETRADSMERVELLLRIARLCEGPLADGEAAFEAYARAVEAEPAEPGPRGELARLASSLNLQPGRAEVLEKAISATADDDHLRAELLQDLAHLWDEGEGERDRAISAYDRLIAVDEDNGSIVLRASQALERLHAEAGDHPALADAIARQVPLEGDPQQQVQLLVRLAEICEGPLNDADRARKVWSDLLEIEPTDMRALMALEQIFQESRNWQDLIGVLRQRESIQDDEAQGRELARRIGEVYERDVRDVDSAIAAYDDVLARFGADRETLASLARIYESTERWSDLLEVVLSDLDLVSEGPSKTALRFRAADLMHMRTDDVEGAVERYRELLEDAPGHAETLGALQALRDGDQGAARIAAARALCEHHERSADFDQLIRSLEVVAESDDNFERIKVYRRAAEVAEVGLQEVGRAFKMMGMACRAASNEESIGAMLKDLARLARISDSWQPHSDLLLELVPELLDEELQVRELLRVAELARDRLDDPTLSRNTFAGLLEIRPDHLLALKSLEALHRAAGDHVGLLEVLRRRTEICDDVPGRQQLLLQQGRLCADHISDLPAAIEAYEEVVDALADAEVYSELEQIYRRAERWEELGSMFERQLDAGVGEAVMLRFASAQLCKEQLQEPERALELFQQVLERDGVHEGTRDALESWLGDEELQGESSRLLEPVYVRSEQWSKLVGVLEIQVAREEGPAERKQLLARIAQLSEQRLGDAGAALEVYARLFREDPEDPESIDVLSRLAHSLGHQERLAEVYEAWLQEAGVETESAARLAVASAEIREAHGGDLSHASKLYGLALQFEPGDRAVAESLESVLHRAHAHQDLLGFYEQQSEIAEDDARRVSLMHKRARILDTDLQDADRAIEAYQGLLDVSPEDGPATEALDRLFTARSRWDELAEHLRVQIDKLAGSPEESALRFRLGGLLETQMEDPRAAVDVYEEITVLDPSHSLAIAALERIGADREWRNRTAEIVAPLHEQSGNWQALCAVKEGLLEVCEDDGERGGVLRDLASLRERRLADPAGAMEAWRAAFVLEPGDEELRAQLDRLAELTLDWDGLVAAFEQGVEASEDSYESASLLRLIARTHDVRREDPRAAIDAYERLISTDPDAAMEVDETGNALDNLESLHTMVSDWRGLVVVLRRKVEACSDPLERAALWRRVGSVQEDLLGDPRGAIEAFKGALEELEDDLLSLESLERLHGEREEREPLAGVLRRRSQLEPDADLRVKAGLRLGVLLSEQLGRPREAIEAYQRVLEDAPGDPGALLALGTLYRSEALWPDLMDNLMLRREAASTPVQQVSLLHEAGVLQEQRLGDAFEALENYRRVLELDADHEESIQAVMRVGRHGEQRAAADEIVAPLLRAAGRWQELAVWMSAGAPQIEDVIERQSYLLSLAEVHRDGRGDLPGALDTLCEAMILDADDPSVVRMLEQVAAELGEWERLADVMSQRAAVTPDPDLARSLFLRVAEVARDRLEDLPRAVGAYVRALEHSPDDTQILEELDRLYERQESWRELASVLEQRLPLAVDDAQAVDLLVRLGALRERRFADLRGAFDAWRDALERDPANEASRERVSAQLEDLQLAGEAVEVLDVAWRATEDLAQVAELYDVRIRLAGNDGEKVGLLQEQAGLYESDLSDLGGAIRAFKAAVVLDPADLNLLDDLERVVRSAGQFESLRGLAEQVCVGNRVGMEDQAQLWMRAARWYRGPLADIESSENALRAAIRVDVEQTEAHALLADILREQGRSSELVETLSTWAEQETDPVTAAERFSEAARVAEGEAQDVVAALRCLERVLDVDPTATAALDEMIRLQEGASEWAAVVELLERRVDAEDVVDQRVALRRRAADIQLEQLGDRAAAIRAHEANLEDDPTGGGALEALDVLLAEASRWSDLQSVLERRVEVSDSDDDRIDTRIRLAQLHIERFEDRPSAVDVLQDALMERPGYPAAAELLESVLHEEKRWGELRELLEQRVDLAIDSGEGELELSLLVRLGSLCDEQEKDSAGAVDFFQRVLERDPEHPQALRALARLHGAEGDEHAAAEILRKLIERVTGEELVAVGLQLSEFADGALDDPDLALDALRRALTAGIDQERVRGQMRSHFERRGKYQELAELIAQDIEGKPEDAKLAHGLVKLAALQREKLDMPDEALRSLERALEIDPRAEEVLAPLSELYIATGRQRDAVPLLRTIIERCNGRRSKEVAGYHHSLGRAYDTIGETDAAVTAFEQAFKIDLTNIGALVDLAKVAHASGDLERAQKSFHRLLLQKLPPGLPLSKADVYFYLGDIWHRKGDRAKALSMLERAVAENGGHDGARGLMTELRG